MTTTFRFLQILVLSLLMQLSYVAKAQYQLQILHASDLEGGVSAIDRAPKFAAIADTLSKTFPNTLIISAGDNYIPGPFFNAAAEAAVQDTLRAVYSDFYGIPLNDLRSASGRVDVSIMNIIGFDASAFGNHEFDAGTDVVAEIIFPDIRNSNTQARWLGVDFPYLSANLDFTASNLNSRYSPIILAADSFRFNASNFAVSAAAKKIAPAVTFTVGSETIGLVGATTQVLEQISSPGAVSVKGIKSNDMPALAAILQPYIDSLIAMGVNKIILTSHLQQFALEQQLAGLLNHVDIIIAGGSDNILADANDILNPGDVATGTYPFITTNAQGDTVAIVSTDGEYSYVGRLVVEFDAQGKLLGSSINPAVSGIYAATNQVLDNVWDSVAAFAPGTKGHYVARLTNTVRDIVIQKDGNILGKTNVFLNGVRANVRTEETNLGNLSADANLWVAKKYDPSVAVSIKNGGGIRAAIGEVVETSPGVYQFLPPQANAISGKQTGEISQLDVENSMRFNNRLSIMESDAAGIKALIEHGISAWTPTATPGQFPQVGGVKFSFNPAKPAGSRIQSLVLVDSLGNYTDTIVQNSRIQGNPQRSIKLVTLNFLAGGGDGYPFTTVASNRVDLDTALTDTMMSNFTVVGSEQDALAEYLLAKYSVNAYDEADTDKASDERIQNIAFRADSVLPVNFTLQLLHASDLEGGVSAIDRAPNFAAIVDKLEDEYSNTLVISSGDNYIPGPFFNAAAEAAVQDTLRAVYGDYYGVALNDLRAASGRIDVSIMNIIGFDASTFGNHEFDAGTDVVAEIIFPDIRNSNTQARWLGADFPYLSANLDFSGSNLNSRYTPMIMDADSFRYDVTNLAKSAAAKKIAPATILNVNGEQIGLVAATTQVIAQISSPGGVTEITGGANNMPALAAVLQPYIDSLTARGIDKIIVATHLQQFALEQLLIGLLNNVDIVIAGGSDFLLADPTDTLNPGDVAQGNYPFITQNANGDDAVIVSTDGEYSYVGRLVIEFDAMGKLDLQSLDSNISGAFATLNSVVQSIGASKAPGTKGHYVERLTNTVRDIVIQKDGNILGRTNVFLNGVRANVRTEETNLGNLSADANLWVAKKYDPNVAVSIKNGGGIRAAIGEVVETSPGVYQFLPPQANAISGKQTGEISQLDVENSMRFNNRLSVVETDAAGLRALIEHGISATKPQATPGQFPQVGGLWFSYDTTAAAGSKIQSMVLVDSLGNYTDTIVRFGNLVGNPARTIKVVTLNFLAGGGDGYPFTSVASNRVDLDTVAAVAPGNFSFAPAGSEQDALAEYLSAFHTVNAYDEADQSILLDKRIQLLNARADSIFQPTFSLIGPANGANFTIAGDPAQIVTINWTAYPFGATYTWELQTAAGASLASIPTAADTQLILTYGAIDNLLRTNGVSIGSTAQLRWTVLAATALGTVQADQGFFALSILRDVVTRDFQLLTPADGTSATIEGDATQTVNITWESRKFERGNGNVTYTWLLDVAGNNFANPLASVPSQMSGADTSLVLDFGTINQLLVDNNVTGTLNAIWTVNAEVNGQADYQAQPFALNLTRGIMTGEELLNNVQMIAFPNPTSGTLQINNVPAQFNQFNVVDAIGKQIMLNSITSEQLTIDLSALPQGLYYITFVGNESNKTIPVYVVK